MASGKWAKGHISVNCNCVGKHDIFTELIRFGSHWTRVCQMNYFLLIITQSNYNSFCFDRRFVAVNLFMTRNALSPTPFPTFFIVLVDYCFAKRKHKPQFYVGLSAYAHNIIIHNISTCM